MKVYNVVNEEKSHTDEISRHSCFVLSIWQIAIIQSFLDDYLLKLKSNSRLKEANETEYWLDLLKETGYLNNSEYLSIQFDIKEILKLLTSIVKASKLK